jgi:rSAM/selenodomain-associated transferase 1
MQESALIIFVRNPVPGKVKTRLARTMGPESALSVYRHLLLRTHSITRSLLPDKFIFYDEDVQESDLWENNIYGKFCQQGEDLGERMQNAFDDLFQKGYRKLGIIGSDCYELTQEIIEEGFHRLDRHDLVLGPSTDGGYYLLGMKKMTTSIFTGKAWSTSAVFRDTLRSAQDYGLSHFLLPLLTDVDEEKDIPLSLKRLL